MLQVAIIADKQSGCCQLGETCILVMLAVVGLVVSDLGGHYWGEPERAPHDQSNGDRVCLSVCLSVCVSIVRSHSVYMRVLI